MAETAQAVALARISEHEAATRKKLVTKFFRAIGTTRLFAIIYRYIGPPIDTFMSRHLGIVPGRLYGFPALLLVTKGNKSGLPRTSPLLYVRDGQDFVVVGTNFGQQNHPAWSKNLLADPRATVEIGPDRVEVTGSQIEEVAFKEIWPRLVEIYPGYPKYIERSGRTPRMFRLRPN